MELGNLQPAVKKVTRRRVGRGIGSGLGKTSVYVFAFIFLKPLFGNLLYKGVWPPSKPLLTPPPDLAFWPLWPFPEVFPRI